MTPETEATETPKAEKVFTDGRYTEIVDRELKPRGKGNEKDAPATKVKVTVIEVNSLDAALPALLDTVGNNEQAALDAVNSMLERTAVKVVYDATFGDEIKVRNLAKTLAAAGIPEAIAMEQARKIVAAKSL